MSDRPHKLTPEELLDLQRKITELELELPRRATDFEYAPWQVKDQLRQARGIETKLGLNKPSNEKTRMFQRRVADILIFLEQVSVHILIDNHRHSSISKFSINEVRPPKEGIFELR